MHTEIIETVISFKFVNSIYQNDLSLLQNASITKQINVIECNNPKYWYKLERCDVIQRLKNDQKELQKINQQLEELNISLRDHIASIDFKDYYRKLLHDYHQLVCQRHDLEKTIDYWQTNLRILNTCIGQYQII